MENLKPKNTGCFIDYLKIALICNLAFAIPSLAMLLGFRWIELNFAIFIFGLSFLLKSPIVGGLGWLIVKGSNGVNKLLTLKVMGAIPGMFFCTILGSSMAINFFSQIYTFIFIVFTFLVGIVAGIFLGPKIGSWILIEVS